MDILKPDFNKSYRYINVWLVMICLAILLLMLVLVVNNSIKQIKEELDTSSQTIYRNAQTALGAGEYVLEGFQAYFKTVDVVDFRKLEEYSRTIRREHPFIYMTQYMIRVEKNEAADFIRERRLEGYATYRITQYDNSDDKKLIPVTDRSVYYPLVFMEPLEIRSLPLLGFDVLSYDLIKTAVRESVKSGKARATTTYTLPNGDKGYVIISPIFTTDNLPEEVDQRHELATRLVAVAVNTDMVLDEVHNSEKESLSLSFYDPATSTFIKASSINEYAINPRSSLPVFSSTHMLHIAGQAYQLELKRQLMLSDIDFDWIAFAFITTAAFSLLLFNFVHLRIQSAKASQRAQAELYHEREHAQVTLHSISEAVITTDVDKNIIYMNPIARRITGWNEADAIGQPLDSVFRLIHEETRKPVDSTVDECLSSQSTVLFEEPALLVNKNGDEFAVENSSSPIRGHKGELIGAVLVFRNITHIRNLSKKMEFQATHDALTGLINRHEFEQQLKAAVHSAREEERSHAICYLDLDQFKVVNDTCGHIAGDQLLKELASLMPNSIRASDCLARLGGDEFGVLMFDCPLKQAEKVADSLRAAIKDFTFSWDKKTFDVGVSVGLVPIDKDSGSVQDVLRRSDTACYIAKDLGRNRVHIYTPDDTEIAKRHGELQWVTRIKNALKNDQFQLALQSVIPIQDAREKIHYEILLRMLDDNGDVIPPMSFIPAAERYDMMPELDKWVIRNTFSKIREEQRLGKPLHIYNINISGQTLCGTDILDYIKEQIESYEIDASRLCFEITETAVIANLSLAIDFISRMKKLGCMFALDDFGSGLSSFAYLKKLPVDYLKIDGEFVRDITHDPMDRAIVSAINDIGHEIGLITVAEYVENEQIFSVLKNMGIDYAQGYGIEKPFTWTIDNVIEFNAAMRNRSPRSR